jgi:predicted ATPase
LTEQQNAPRVRTPDQRLRVFISSTLGELAAERKAARDAVEHLRLSPIMFELGARPHPPRALYRSYLEQSDVFVGIYWQRYGWVAPDMEISGLEDEYVLSAGMPRLVYVKRPAPDMEPRLREMLAHLQEEGTTSYKPFSDAAELRGLLLDDLALMLAERFDAVAAPAAPTTSPTNLPRPASTFLGREEVLTELDALLDDDDVRLVTLTGPGGTGKTRLAVEAAAGRLERFEDGVFFVDLSQERAPEDAYAAIVRAVPIGETGDDPPLEALKRGLRDRHILLVLDNFEQVSAAATGVAELLERCPRLQAVATSREALHIRGERRFPVPPLSLPTANGSLSVENGVASEAIRLFGERAAAVQAGFEVTDANVADIAAICTRLDGLPLAIELAAARINLFSVDELRDRLDAHVHVLGSGGHDLPERQQTLRRTIEWSNELLTEPERTLFWICSVFLQARLADIEASVARIPSLASLDVMEGIGSLVDKSLVRSTSGADGRPRFSMLQTIRDYAVEELDSQPELAAAVRRAHAEHYSEVAAALRESSGALDRKAALARLAGELGNLRAAWSYWLEHGDVARLNDLLEPLWGYYHARGNYRAAMELGDEMLGVLVKQPETPERARDQVALEMSLARSLIAVRGFSADAEPRIRAAVDRSDAAGEAPQGFPTLRSLATLHMLRSDFDRTSALASELLVLAEHLQDPALLGEAHLVVGVTLLWAGDMSGALRHIEEATKRSNATSPSVVQLRVGPDPGVLSHIVSGLAKWMAGFPDQGEAAIATAFEIADKIDHPYSMGYCLFHATLLDLWREDLGRVAERSAELLRLAETHDYPIWRALAHVLRGTARIASGESDPGFAELDEGFVLYEGLSTPPIFWPALLAIRAGANLIGGRVSEALAIVREAQAIVRENDPLMAELLVTHGDILLAATPPDVSGAEDLYRRAGDVARDLGARMVELQVATRLATLREGKPDEEEARTELRDLLETFTEGFDAPQLVAARAALAGDRS